jgi:tetratricopeptide (TPR) repeat protein
MKNRLKKHWMLPHVHHKFALATVAFLILGQGNKACANPDNVFDPKLAAAVAKDFEDARKAKESRDLEAAKALKRYTETETALTKQSLEKERKDKEASEQNIKVMMNAHNSVTHLEQQEKDSSASHHAYVTLLTKSVIDNGMLGANIGLIIQPSTGIIQKVLPLCRYVEVPQNKPFSNEQEPTIFLVQGCRIVALINDNYEPRIIAGAKPLFPDYQAEPHFRHLKLFAEHPESQVALYVLAPGGKSNALHTFLVNLDSNWKAPMFSRAEIEKQQHDEQSLERTSRLDKVSNEAVQESLIKNIHATDEMLKAREKHDAANEAKWARQAAFYQQQALEIKKRFYQQAPVKISSVETKQKVESTPATLPDVSSKQAEVMINQEIKAAGRQVSRLKGDPAKAEAASALGIIALNSKTYAKAEEHFSRAHAWAPSEANYLDYLSRAEMCQSKLTIAKAHLLQTLALAPKKDQCWNELAMVYAKEGETSKSLSAFITAYDISGSLVFLEELAKNHDPVLAKAATVAIENLCAE